MITVVLLTYDRLAVACRCLGSVAANLRASEPFWLHVADDGSSQDYRDELAELARSLYGNNVSVTNSQRTGYGGNYNAATMERRSIGQVYSYNADFDKLERIARQEP